MSGGAFIARLGEPEREIAARLFAAAPYGRVLTYAELAEALERDPDDERRAIQGAVRRSIELLERAHRRTLEAVPSVGYRVVEPTNHARLSDNYARRSRRSLRRSMSIVQATPVAMLTAGERLRLEDRVERLERVEGAFVAVLTSHEQRIAALERERNT